jgi:hypothetical protein
LAGTDVSDDGLAALAVLKNLRQLGLQGTDVSDDGARSLQKSLPDLKIVR